MSRIVTRSPRENPVAAERGSPACPLCGARAEDLFAVPDCVEGRQLFDLKRCRRCLFAFVHPIPDERARAAFRANDETYYAIVDAHRTVFEDAARLLLDAVALHRRPPGRLLDVGCGRGIVLAEAARRGWTPVGLDLSPGACKAAQSLGLHAIEGDFRGADLGPEGFDVILLQQVIEHSSEPASLLDRARALLPPDGILYVATPNAAGLLARARGPAFNYWIPPEHVFHYSPRALRLVLERNGFEVVRLSTFFCVSPVTNDLRDLSHHHPWFRRMPPRLARFALRRLRPHLERLGEGTILEAFARPRPS